MQQLLERLLAMVGGEVAAAPPTTSITNSITTSITNSCSPLPSQAPPSHLLEEELVLKVLATMFAADDAEWIVSSGALSKLHAAARRRSDPPAHAALHAVLMAVVAAAPLPAASDATSLSRLPSAALRVLTEQIRGFIDRFDKDKHSPTLATACCAENTAAVVEGGEGGAGRALLRYLQLLVLIMPPRLRDALPEEASTGLAPLLISLAEDPPPQLGARHLPHTRTGTP
jgi:hypothetical protein